MNAPDSGAAPGHAQRTRFVDLCEETTGFGVREWRTFRDLLLRPGAATKFYIEHGPTGGGRYARPFGFYLALVGVLMFYLFLLGGMKGIIEQQPPEVLERGTAVSGKIREVFIDDVDDWLALISVPLMSALYALFSAPFIKWWSGLDWRRACRVTFALLCAWTVPMLLLGPLPYTERFALLAAPLMLASFVQAFVRMGRGIWWRSWPEGLAKCILLFVALQLAGWLGMAASMQLSLLGATYGN